MIDGNRPDRIGAYSILIFIIVIKPDYFPGYRIKFIQTASVCTNPEYTIIILYY